MINRIKNFLLTTFLGGAIVILPITIFVFLFKLIFNFINRILEPLSNWINVNHRMNEILVDLIAIAAIVAFCFMVGLFVKTQIGNNLFSYIETEWLKKLPLYNTIKEIVQQFSGAKKTPFKQVILADVFNSGAKMTGFVTDEHENGNYTIFVPTAPNPTNGFIFHVTKEQIEFLDVNTEDAMRSVIGMGVGSGESLEIGEVKVKAPGS